MFREIVKEFGLLTALVFFTPLPAFAEHVCRAEVSYIWEAPEKPSVVAPLTTPAAAGPTATPEEMAIQPESRKQTVNVGAVERTGATADEGKTALNRSLGRVKIRASESCTRDHEDVSGCVAGKMTTVQSVLNAMSFNARRELEKAVTEDCSGNQGRCVGVTVSEIVCTERIVPTPIAAEGAEVDAKGGKDAKKKK